MRYDVITIFDTCVDLIVNLGDTVPEFGQKEKWFDSFTLGMGGSCCIFACQCAKLGLKTTGVGAIGNDTFGQVVTDTMRKSGVDISHIKKDEALSTGLGVLLTREGDRSILTYSGTIGAARPEMLTDELLSASRHLHIGSYYLLTGVKDSLPDIAKRAKNYGLTVSLDTNWDPEEKWDLPDELLSSIDIIIPNENEAMLLTGAADILDAAQMLIKKVPLVAIKLGAEGGMVVSKEGYIRLPAMDVAVVDTIGAGDCFAAGFVYAYLNGENPEKCLRAGIYCGSMNTTCSGATAGQVDSLPTVNA